ncbi:MAG: hypothetical protein KJ709_06405 [Nanoarchaeota archaeon]|nr:hypothetical protein [Nanoarchaeota archaeon]
MDKKTGLIIGLTTTAALTVPSAAQAIIQTEGGYTIPHEIVFGTPGEINGPHQLTPGGYMSRFGYSIAIRPGDNYTSIAERLCDEFGYEPTRKNVGRVLLRLMQDNNLLATQKNDFIMGGEGGNVPGSDGLPDLLYSQNPDGSPTGLIYVTSIQEGDCKIVDLSIAYPDLPPGTMMAFPRSVHLGLDWNRHAGRSISPSSNDPNAGTARSLYTCLLEDESDLERYQHMESRVMYWDAYESKGRARVSDVVDLVIKIGKPGFTPKAEASTGRIQLTVPLHEILENDMDLRKAVESSWKRATTYRPGRIAL